MPINISDVVNKLITDSEAALQPLLIDATQEGLDAVKQYLANLEALVDQSRHLDRLYH